MALEPGQIIGTDLSPNANILGTQIADKTLQFRNFSEDVFKIALKGTTTVPGHTLTGAAGTYTQNQSSITIAHNLGYVPAILMFNGSSDGAYRPVPSGNVAWATGANYFINIGTTYVIDSVNLNIYNISAGYGVASGYPSGYAVPAVAITYYLLQETAN